MVYHCRVGYDFLGKVETLSSDVDYLNKTGIFPLNLTSLFQEKFNKSGNKTQKNALLYFAQLPKETVLKLYSLFEDDFEIGGYEYPNEYLQVAKMAVK